MEFKVNDLVKVFRQPPKEPHDLVGVVGVVISPPKNGAVAVLEISKEGNESGSGPVPIDCLQICDDPEWVQAYAHYQVKYKQQVEAASAFQKAMIDKKYDLAQLYGLSIQHIEEIFYAYDKTYADEYAKMIQVIKKDYDHHRKEILPKKIDKTILN